MYFGEIAMRPTKLLAFIMILTVLSSCGSKKNETGGAQVIGPTTPPLTVNPNTNIFGPYDPSFEEQMERPARGRAGIKIYEHFRVRSLRGGGQSDYEITNQLANSGSKSLRLMDAENQIFIYPTDTSRKGYPLSLVAGARYRLNYKIRLPNNRNSSASRWFQTEVEVNFKDQIGPNGSLSLDQRISWPTNNGWTDFLHEFEVPVNITNAKMTFRFNGSRDLLIDDLILVRIR